MLPTLPELVFINAIKLGEFEVDDEGRVWRLMHQRDGKLYQTARRRAEHPTGKDDYLQIRKMIDGKRICVAAHRVVYWWFKGPIPDGLEINHKNGRKQDNWPDNLEPLTSSGNIKHAHATGLIDQRGERNPAALLSSVQVRSIRERYAAGGVSQADLAREFGVSFQCISKIARGARRSVDGGPVADYVGRRSSAVRDAAGRVLDGRTHDEYPA